MAAYGPPASVAQPPFGSGVSATIIPTPTASSVLFNLKMTDDRTGQTFTINNFTGSVAPFESMTLLCSNCQERQNEIKELEALTNYSKNLVSIRLVSDLHEDAVALKEYINNNGFDWYFTISTLMVGCALANLYSTEFLNPPMTPILFIDRQGGVFCLPFGPFNGAAAIQRILTPYLIE